mgnify:CR=1 FL=1
MKAMTTMSTKIVAMVLTQIGQSATFPPPLKLAAQASIENDAPAFPEDLRVGVFAHKTWGNGFGVH